MEDIRIEKSSTDEPNISNRSLRFDVFRGETHIATFLDVVSAMEFVEGLHEAR